jgi:hypothetical protein
MIRRGKRKRKPVVCIHGTHFLIIASTLLSAQAKDKRIDQKPPANETKVQLEHKLVILETRSKSSIQKEEVLLLCYTLPQVISFAFCLPSTSLSYNFFIIEKVQQGRASGD